MPTRSKWTLSCLRCHAPILDYMVVQDPIGKREFRARIECGRCGHFDFLFLDSEYLTGLRAKPC
jgi:hypothetical protein